MSIEELVDGIRQNDQEKISELYKLTYYNAMYIARSFTHDPHVAEDIVQESYIKAFSSIDSLNDYSKFQSWFNMIVTNKSKDWLKKKKEVMFTDMASDDDEGVAEFDAEDTSVTFNPEAKVDYAETKRLVKEMIDNLPDEQRISMIMYYMEEMPVKDIASIMECSENTIKSRLNYGRKFIKERVLELEKQGTKLYCFPLIPFLYWMFRQDIWNMVSTTATVASGAAAAGGLAGSAAKAGATTTAKTTATKVGISLTIKKVAIGAALVATAGTATVVAVNHHDLGPKIKITEEEDEFLKGMYEQYMDMDINDIDDQYGFTYYYRNNIKSIERLRSPYNEDSPVEDRSDVLFYNGKNLYSKADGNGIAFIDSKWYMGEFKDGKPNGRIIACESTSMDVGNGLSSGVTFLESNWKKGILSGSIKEVYIDAFYCVYVYSIQVKYKKNELADKELSVNAKIYEDSFSTLTYNGDYTATLSDGEWIATKTKEYLNNTIYDPTVQLQSFYMWHYVREDINRLKWQDSYH